MIKRWIRYDVTDVNTDSKQHISCNNMDEKIKKKEKKGLYIKVRVFIKLN